jgi:hypothetical protein
LSLRFQKRISGSVIVSSLTVIFLLGRTTD